MTLKNRRKIGLVTLKNDKNDPENPESHKKILTDTH